MDGDEQPPDRSGSLHQHLRPELFRALCDPTRLQVLGRLALASGPQTVTEVAGCCGVHLSGVSRHLACLRDAGVVTASKVGREVRYSLEREELTTALRGLADAIDACGEGSECCPGAHDNDDVQDETQR